jgi:hypothetical protein
VADVDNAYDRTMTELVDLRKLMRAATGRLRAAGDDLPQEAGVELSALCRSLECRYEEARVAADQLAVTVTDSQRAPSLVAADTGLGEVRAEMLLLWASLVKSLTARGVDVV